MNSNKTSTYLLLAAAGIFLLDRMTKRKPMPGIGEISETEYYQFYHKPKAAIEFLKEKESGIAVAALYHKKIGDIDIVWGESGDRRNKGHGLAKIIDFHPEVMNNLQKIISKMKVVKHNETTGYLLRSKDYQANIREKYNGSNRRWLMTVFIRIKKR